MANPWDSDPILTPAGGGTTAPTPWANDPIVQKTRSSDYESMITQAATKYGVPEKGLRALIKQESNFNPNAVSPKGASGIAQFMPDTAKQFGIDPLKPEQAIPAAAQYLRQNYDQFGSWDKAVAAYNAGPTRVQAGGVLPAETQNYTAKLSPAFVEAQGSQLTKVAATSENPWENDPITKPAEQGFLEKQIVQPLKQSYQSMRQGSGVTGAKAYQDRLAIFDQIDKAQKEGGSAAVQKITDLYPDPEIKQYGLLGIAHPEKQQEMRKQYEQNIQAGVEKSAAGTKALEAMPVDPALQELATKVNKGDWWGVGGYLLENPGILTRAAIGSTLQSAQGIAMAPILGPAGVGLGDMGAQMQSALVDTMQSAGVDMKDPKAIRQALLDPHLMAAARRKMTATGLPILAFDTLTAGIAGRALLPAKTMEKTLGKVGELGLQTGVQAAGGGAGEAAGQIAYAGKITDPTSVLLNTLAEIPGGAPEALALGAMAGKYTKGPDVGAPMQDAELNSLFQGTGHEVPGTPPATPTEPTTTPSGIQTPGQTKIIDLGGMGQAIGENLRSTLYNAYQAGSTKENNQESVYLQVAQRIKQNGRDLTPEEFSQVLNQTVKANALQGVDRQTALQGIVSSWTKAGISPEVQAATEAVKGGVTPPTTTVAQRVAALPQTDTIVYGATGISGPPEALSWARRAARMRDEVTRFTAENNPEAVATAQAAAEKYMQQAEAKGFTYQSPEEAARLESVKRGMTSVGAIAKGQTVPTPQQGLTTPENIFTQNPSFYQNPIEQLKANLPGRFPQVGPNLYTVGEHPNLAKVMSFVRPLASRIMPGMKLIIDTRPDSNFVLPGMGASYTGFKGNYGVISLHPSVLENEALTTAAITHELGHAIVHYHWASTPTDQQQAIYAAFGRHLVQVFGPDATAGMFLDDLHSPFALATMQRIYQSKLQQGSVDFLKESQYASWYSFDEWIAESASKWMFTNRQTVTLMDRFFKSIGDAMEKVLKMVGRGLSSFAPEKEVKAWLDSMIQRRAGAAMPLTVGGSLDQYRTGVEENARALGLPVPGDFFRDKKGDVQTFYHGTNLEFDHFKRFTDRPDGAFYFTPRKRTAENYATTASYRGGSPKILVANLRLQNPKILDMEQISTIFKEQADRWKTEGYDGAISYNKDGSIYEIAVFDPEQISINPGTLASVIPPQAETIPLRSLAMNLPGIFSKKTLAESDKWSGFIKLTNNLLQLATKNPHILGLQSYVESTRAWWIAKMGVTSQAVGRLREWRSLGKEMGQNLDRFVFDVDSMSYIKEGENARHPTTPEIAMLARKHGLNREAVNTYLKIKQDFLGVLDRLEKAWIQDATRSYGEDPLKLSAVIQEINTDMAQLRSKPYFPHERFGNWTVTVREKGKVVRYEQTATEKEAITRARVLKTQNPGFDVSSGRLADGMQVFRGLPPSLIRAFAAKLPGLTPEQRAAAQDLAFQMSPANSFSKKFIQRKGTSGFSLDAQRAYASYFLHAGSHIARLEQRANMEDGIRAVADSAKAMRGVEAASPASDRQGIADWMGRHFEYVMNPPNEWTGLRGVGFFWYMWGNVSSAILNLAQTPMFAYPHITAKYGDFSTINGLRKATLDFHKTLNLDKGRLAKNELMAIGKAKEQEFLDESFATELAAMAQGGVMQRILPGTGVERGLMNLMYFGAWGFQKAEQVNRMITFLTDFRLANQKPNSKHLAPLIQANQQLYKQLLGEGWTPQNAAAFLSGRQAVERSHFEYGQFARPEFVRGPKGVVFAFWMWTQNALWFFKNDPGRMRALAMMFVAGGLMGLPFASDIADLIRYIAWMAGKNFNPEQELRKLLVEMHVNPDLVLHGPGHDSFGLAWAGQQVGIPIPNVDLSQRLGMGQIVPGVHDFFDPTGGTFEERTGRAAKSALGAIYGIPLTMIKAAESNDPHVWHNVQQFLPIAFKNFAKMIDTMERGGVQTPGGATIAKIDPTDVHGQAELAAMALGFVPSKVSVAYDEMAAIKDAVAYWTQRRMILFQQFAVARFAKDREAIADARAAIKEFNRTAPDSRLKISADELISSLQSRQRANILLEKNRVESPTYQGVAREIKKNYP